MGAFLETVFEFLLKYRPIVFEKGRLAFASPWPLTLLILVTGAALALAVFTYTRTRTRRPRDVVMLTTLRVAALGLLAFCLARPMLLIPTVIPQRNFLGVLIDDSRSMSIADADALTRKDLVQRHFGAPDSALRAALEERFLLRFYRFSQATARIDDPSVVGADGRVTDLAQALDAARRDLAAVPVAGLVVLTDGADNSGSSLTESMLALQSASVPVYTVGLGRERFARDIEITRVETPGTALKGSSLAVDLVVEQHGFGRQTVPVTVEDAGRIVATQEVRLPPDGESATVRVQFTVDEPGPRVFRFHIAAQADEAVVANNERRALIVVEDGRQPILYFEGEPRFEVKFLRRAVADDENIRVVTLQRTAENKYLRLDVERPDELAGGFPRTREELFRYRGLILGSVEASYFTHDQLTMIEEFVGQRGGGLLVLGGRSSFGRGGYAGTPVENVLPVDLPALTTAESFYAEVEVEPTRLGIGHPVTQIAVDAEQSTERWSQMPPVSAVNPVISAKPGASTLLSGDSPELDDPLIVLAFQRYGRGKAVALPIQDSWMWQMHADVPLDDMTHETFWRQLLRWLVSNVPDRVMARPQQDRADVGSVVDLSAEVQDETFLRVNNASVVARVTAPSGSELEMPLEWAVDSDGEYRGGLRLEEEGIHRISVTAREGGTVIGEHTAYVEASDLGTEYFSAEMRAPLLQRIAEETGGRFYTPATVDALAEDVSFTESGTTVIEERDLWDMPLIFIALLGLVGAEWIYRRQRGLV